MTYSVQPNDRFFQVFCSLPEREINPGPSVTFCSLVDLTEVEALREVAQAAGNRKYSYTALVIKAVAMALREFPYANRRIFRRFWLPFLRPRLVQFHAIDIGVAAARDLPGRESAAFVDVLRDADTRTLGEITEFL